MASSREVLWTALLLLLASLVAGCRGLSWGSECDIDDYMDTDDIHAAAYEDDFDEDFYFLGLSRSTEENGKARQLAGARSLVTKKPVKQPAKKAPAKPGTKPAKKPVTKPAKKAAAKPKRKGASDEGVTCSLEPVKKSEVPLEKSKLPVKKSKVSLKKSKLPVKKSKLPVKKSRVKSKLPVKKSKVPLKKPKPPVKKAEEDSRDSWSRDESEAKDFEEEDEVLSGETFDRPSGNRRRLGGGPSRMSGGPNRVVCRAAGVAIPVDAGWENRLASKVYIAHDPADIGPGVHFTYFTFDPLRPPSRDTADAVITDISLRFQVQVHRYHEYLAATASEWRTVFFPRPAGVDPSLPLGRFLPFGENQIRATRLTTPPGANDPKYFFTSRLTGCSVFIDQGPGTDLIIYHANYQRGAEDLAARGVALPADPAARRVVVRPTNRLAMQTMYNNFRVTAGATAGTPYLARLEAETYFPVDVESDGANAIGIWDATDNRWKFYYQTFVVRATHITKFDQFYP